MHEAMVLSGLLAIWGDGHRAAPVVKNSRAIIAWVEQQQAARRSTID
jgi:hypothetical protein